MKYILSILLVLNLSYVHAAENMQPIKGAHYFIRHAGPEDNYCIRYGGGKNGGIVKNDCPKHENHFSQQVISFFNAKNKKILSIKIPAGQSWYGISQMLDPNVQKQIKGKE